MMTAPRALLFDMDGLLLDTERLYFRSWQAAAAQCGLHLPEPVILGMVGLRQAECRAWLRQQMGEDWPVEGVEAASRDWFHQVLEREGPPLKPGVPRILHFARQHALPCAVATSTAGALARHKLERAGLLASFHHVIAGDDIPRGKPAPDIYLAAARAVATEPRHCLVLEDSLPGVEAGLAAGMSVCMVPDLIAPPEAFAARGVWIAASLDLVCQTLGRRLEHHAT